MKLFICLINFMFLSIAANAKILNLNEITQANKVALLIAEGKGLGQSAFGHAYLRFAVDNFTDSDIAVEIVANQDNASERGFGFIFKGLGLNGVPYKSKIIAADFLSVKYEMTILQDRNLTTYPLKISSEKVKELTQYILNKENDFNNDDYKFLTNNCATKVSSALDEILGFKKGVFYKIVPTLLDKKYQSVIDLENIITDRSATNLRKFYVESEFPAELKNNSHPYLQNITEQLLSESFFVRVYAIIKLANLEKILSTLEKPVLGQVKVFLMLWAQTETGKSKNEIIDLIKKKSKKVFMVPLFNKYEDYALIHNNIEPQSTYNSKVFLNEKNELIGRFFYSSKDQMDSAQKSERYYDVKLSNFGFKLDKNKIFYNDKYVGSIARSKIYDNADFLQNIIFQSEVYKGQRWDYLVPTALIEATDDASTGFKSPEFDASDFISVQNFSRDGLGQCISLVYIQKMLLEQTKFFPNQERLTQEQNFALFQKALQGNLIMIPGYNNVGEWILSLDQLKFKDAVSDLGFKLNVEGFGGLMLKYFTRIQISEKNISDLDISLSMGITVPLRFKVDNKKAEHMILVHQIVDRGDYYELGVYDPNVGGIIKTDNDLDVAQKFKIDKKTGLFSQAAYSKGTQIYADIIDIRYSEFYKRQQSRADLLRLFEAGKQREKYFFSPRELTVN